MQQDEFIKVIKGHEGIIYKIAKVYALDKEHQRDLYQEIVLQLWKSIKSFKGDARLSTWLYRVALNTAITYMKRRQKIPITRELDEQLNLQIDYTDHLKEERLNQLYAQIKRLNAIEKGIILLYLEDKSHEEISTIVGLSKSNVGTRISRIKEKLRAQILKN